MLEAKEFSVAVYIPILASLVAAYCVTFYLNLNRKHRFWYNQGVKGEWLLPVWGHLLRTFTVDRLEAERRLGEKYGKIYTDTSFDGRPQLIIADPDVIKQILIKDFDNFTDRDYYPYPNRYQENYLVWLRGDRWRRMRSLMSPSFTSGKIKHMFKLFSTCAEDLLDNFHEQSRDTGAVVNLHDVYSLYTLDGITTCGYGIKLKREKGDSSIQTAAAHNALIADVVRIIQSQKASRIAYMMTMPRFFLTWSNFSYTPDAAYEPLIKRLDELVRTRKEQAKMAQRQDNLLQLLMDAEINDEMELGELDQHENHHANLTHESLVGDQKLSVDRVNRDASLSQKVRLSNLEVLSEAYMALTAGLTTTRTLLSSCTYALAHHQHVQDKLVQELMKIAKVSHGPGGREYNFTYEDITSCQYLDAVVSETLRMFPSTLRVNRLAKNDYLIEKYNVRVPAGAQIFVSIYGVQNAAEFWENPHEFNPERFMPENRDKIVPGSYLPFGMGPRHCIGMRFGLTESKVGLAKAAINFKFEPAPGLMFPPRSMVGILSNSPQCPQVKLTPRH